VVPFPGLTFSGYILSRAAFQRGLALVYLIAFLAALNQFKPLLGEKGLLPAPAFIKRGPFHDSPSLFYLFPKDGAFTAVAWIGIALSCVALLGISERHGLWLSIAIWTLLWSLYMSFVNVGQTFYGFGWESILLEAGFFAIFLGSAHLFVPKISLWMERWLLFRVMFGAGLIKIRGDACWRDFTCLDNYFETQPMPNPLSWYFHWAPHWVHRAGVGFNHVSELIVPFGYFLPQPIASIAGLITLVFQGFIMATGNLSWLNFLTMVLALTTLDDRIFAFLLPQRTAILHESPLAFRVAIGAAGLLVAYMSIDPILNMISPGQVMNGSYNPLHLVGTYGAFGSITRPRYEVIVAGTEEAVLSPSTKWREYEFKGKPGDLARFPPQIAPYHLRLDWLMWFAALSDYRQQPWFVHFLAKLLEGDSATLSLLRANPFPNAPPRYIRAELYEYHFTTPEERRRTGMWWTRQRMDTYFPAVSLQRPGFRDFLNEMGWQ
jgi:hypothetical protein